MSDENGTLALEDIEIAGIDDYPADESVKLFGPPGTGKTTNAAARVAKLLRDHDYSINDVVWITYRKSLAMDTLRRLSAWGVVDDEELSEPNRGATKYIGTAHAVASRVVGGTPDPAEYGDKKAFCAGRNLKYDKSTPWDNPPGQLLFRVFNYANKNLLDPTDESDLRKIPAIQDLREKYRGSIPRAYRDWEDYKDSNNIIDFWEMLAAPLEEGVTPGKSILVIDEYHDAYPLMAKLAEEWAENTEIVIAAGDPHQVVNTYDGADPEFYQRLDYPEILLPKSYRVPFEHWEPATRLLSNAHEPPEVERDSRGVFQVQRSPTFSHDRDGWRVPNPSDEYGPADIVESYGDDTMLLTRTTHQLDGVARALEEAGTLFEVPTSSDVTGWGAPANDSMSDRVAIYNALQKIKRLEPAMFKDSAGSGLGQYSDGESGVDPSRVVLEPTEAATLLDRANAKYLTEKRSKITETASSWVDAEESVTASDLTEYVEPEFWGTYTQASRSLHYLNKTGRLGRAFSNRDFGALGNALRENNHPVGGSLPTKVYTIHASKGNEAETVAVYDGVTKRIMESMNRDEAERRNEWRTWYVAFTRASENLIVLKDGFEFTRRFLPKGRKLKDEARRGVALADGSAEQ
ncbi:UvrD-helicase domain-containing protein [Halosimplex marinum]|uniref:UvrD-helicase domain-containing protein n=1 Tax=Halosimplex marinum TaxID=3396620 RepID=UPI003F56542A